MFETVKSFLQGEGLKYYTGHKARFELMYSLFDKHLSDKPINLVYDLGTSFPFVSYYFAIKGAKVVYGCEKKPADCGIANTMPIEINLNYPSMLPKADLVICTEVLEHLPCNLYNVRDYLVKLVNDEGYLLLSFPTGKIFFDEYGKDLSLPKDIGHNHLREFPVAKAREFYNGTGLKLIEEKTVKTSLYIDGEGILHALLRKI